MIGTVISHFKIIDEFVSSGMGIIYKFRETLKKQ